MDINWCEDCDVVLDEVENRCHECGQPLCDECYSRNNGLCTECEDEYDPDLDEDFDECDGVCQYCSIREECNE